MDLTAEVLNDLAKEPSIKMALSIAQLFPHYDVTNKTSFYPWFVIALIKIAVDNFNNKELKQLTTFLELKGYNTKEIIRYLE